MPTDSPDTVNGPLPMTVSACPGPKPSSALASVESDTSPELMVEVACAKPGAGAVKWNLTVSASTTSPRS